MIKMIKIPAKRKKILLVASCLIIIGVILWAIRSGKIQISANGVYPQLLSGKVYTRTSGPLAGAKITNVKTGDTVNSGADGSYGLQVPAGRVTLRVEKDGTNYPVSFTDVPSTYWAAKWIGALVNAGVIKGYGDNTFRPDEEISRAQMAVFLARALARGDDKVPAADRQIYSDVPTSYWAVKYINYLYNTTAIKGYGDNTYKPEDKVTRGQMAVFIGKALNADPYTAYTPSFPDVAADYWAYSYIEAMVNIGVAQGYSDGTYRPEEVVNRAQMSVFVGRAFNEIPLTSNGYAPQMINIEVQGSSNPKLDFYLAKTGLFGRITGKLIDAAGSNISGARVVISLGPLSNEEYAATTDSGGNFSIFNIPAGRYIYYVTKKGQSRFVPAQEENSVNVKANTTTELGIKGSFSTP